MTNQSYSYAQYTKNYGKNLCNTKILHHGRSNLSFSKFHFFENTQQKNITHTILNLIFFQADKKEKVKKKKVKEDAPAEEAAPASPAAPASAAGSERASSRGSRKAAKRSGSNVFSMFSQKQVAEFKEVGLWHWNLFSIMSLLREGGLRRTSGT